MAIGVHHHPTVAAAAEDGGLWPAFVDTPASAKHRPRASEKENNGISSFYGSDDLTDMCDLLYKEDLFEHVRRATDTECFKNRKRSTGFLMSCFEFLKLFFSKS
uniref:Uncharacterized protein n=1 Tax=Cannabis sativa TaxID=3483 RepID=A0A803NV08_CANSA